MDLSRVGIALLGILGLLGVPVRSALGAEPQSNPEGQLESRLAAEGREHYVQYCGACHGPEGRGDGPVGEALRDRPADLTGIAKRREGVFPEPAIAEFIDGRRYVRAHGPGDMPVWGRRLGAEVAGGEQRDIEIRSRILLIVEYLKSIQK
jgi:mono/diheme cytochrome c family protein